MIQRGSYTFSESPNDVQCLNARNISLTCSVSRLHWRVRGGRRPPLQQDCCPAQRPPQQDRCHLPPLQRPPQRAREVGCQAPSRPSVRLRYPDHLGRNHGPRGGSPEARLRQDHRLLLLETGGVDGAAFGSLVRGLLGVAEITVWWILHPADGSKVHISPIAEDTLNKCGIVLALRRDTYLNLYPCSESITCLARYT